MADDFNPSVHGDSEALLKQARRLEAEAKASFERAEAFKGKAGASGKKLTKQIQEEAAAERVRTKAIGETETSSRQAAKATRAEDAAIKRNTEIIRENVLARRQARLEAAKTQEAAAGQQVRIAERALRTQRAELEKALQVTNVGGARPFRIQDAAGQPAAGTGRYASQAGAERKRSALLGEGLAAQEAKLARATAKRAVAAEKIAQIESVNAREVARTALAEEKANTRKLAADQEAAAAAERTAAAEAKRTAAATATAASRRPSLTHPQGPLTAEQTAIHSRQQFQEANRLYQNASKRKDEPLENVQGLKADRDAKYQAARAAQSQAKAALAPKALSGAAGQIDEVAASQKRLAGVSSDLARSQQRLAVAYGSSSQSLRKHGALTTEFISAAARGEASYREWGYQIGATAGKFAGWTLVSVPVFAALEGIRKIGEGAIASSSGVGQLQRVVNGVDPSKLKGDFRDLANQFNVPIDVATDAVARSGQVFKTQAEAVEGAKAALYSYKVGGVGVEESTASLNAIVKAFGLSGKELTGTFDQINQAQNEFGVSINDVEKGVAKAGGTYKNAGGSLSYLLALITTGKLVTGRSGVQVATAIQRSPGQIAKPANQAVLRSFGIDPTAKADQVWEQAFKAVQKRGLKGPQLLKLASALSTPLLAATVVPILAAGDRFKDVQKKTGGKASVGSAQRELGFELGRLDERIAQIGNRLQVLGSNLEDSGLLNAFGLIVLSLDQGLRLTNALLDVFNQLPGPVKTLLSTFLVLRGTLGALRRFNVGSAIVGTRFEGGRSPLARAAPFFLENTNRYQRRLGNKGLREELSLVRDEQEATAKTAAHSNSRARIAAAAALENKRIVDQQFAKGVIKSKEEAEQAILAGNEAAERAGRKAADDNFGATVAAQHTREVEEKDVRRKASIRRGESAAAFHAREGDFLPAQIGAPTSLAPIDISKQEQVRRAGVVAEERSAADSIKRSRKQERARAAAVQEERLKQQAQARRDQDLRPDYGGERGAQRPAPGRGSVAPPVSVFPARRALELERGQDLRRDVAGERGGPSPLGPAPVAGGPRRFRDLLKQQTSALAAQAREVNAAKGLQGKLAATQALGGQALKGGAAAAASAGASLKSFAGAAAGFIGPQGLFIAALFALPAIFSAVKSRYDQLKDLSKPVTVSRQEDINKLKQKLIEQRKAADELPNQIKRTISDPIIGAYELASSAAGAVSSGIDAAGSVLDSIGGTVAGVVGKGKDAGGKAGGKAGGSSGLLRGLGAAVSALPGIGSLVGAAKSAKSYSDGRQKDAEAEAQAQIREAERRRGIFARNDAAGRPSAGRSGKEILDAANADLAELQAGRINRDQFNQRIKNRNAEIATAGKDHKGAQGARASDLKAALSKVELSADNADQAIVATIEARYDFLASQTGDPVKRAGIELDKAVALAREAATGTDPTKKLEADAAVNNARRAKQEADKQRVLDQTAAQKALLTAGLGGRNGLRAFQATTVGTIKGSQGDSPEDRQALATAQTDLVEATKAQGDKDLARALLFARSQRERDEAYADYYKILRSPVRALKRAGAPKKSIVAAQKVERENLLVAARQQFEQQSALQDARNKVQSQNLSPGMPRIRFNIGQIGRKIARAIRLYGRDSVEVLGLIAEQQGLRDEAVQEQGALIEANAGLQAARATTPGGEETAKLKGLADELAHKRANPKTYGASEIVNAEAALLDAQKARRDRIKEEANELLQSQYELRSSRTDDPIAIAKLGAELADKIVARGGFKSKTEENRAKADQNTKHRDVAVAVTDRKLEQLDLDRELEKITAEQQIRGYEQALRSTKAGTEYKRQLKNKILSLKHGLEDDSSELELDLGNVKLPTLYDLKRLIGGRIVDTQQKIGATSNASGSGQLPGASLSTRGRLGVGPYAGGGGTSLARAAATGVTNRNTVTININGTQDYDELGRVLERHVGSTGRAVSRTRRAKSGRR